MKYLYCAIAASVLLASCAHDERASKAHVAPDVTLTVAHVGDFAQTASATGRIGGVNGSQTKVAFAVPGVIKTIYVQIGDRVTAGEALAALDSHAYELSAAQSRADVTVASANARQSAVDRYSTRIAVDEAALRRERALYAAGVAPHKDVDAAEAQVAQDRADAAMAHEQVNSNTAQVESAQVKAASADWELQNTTLRAPVDGVVTAIYRRVGETVDQTTSVFALSPAAVSEVTLSVSGQDIQNVRPGDRVDFDVLGTDLHSTGRVAGVSTAIDPATQTGTVVATGLPTGAAIGSVVQATITIARRRGVVVPETAIVQDPQTGNAVTFVATNGRDGGLSFQQRVVKVAMHNQTSALIASGLHPGERVASRGGFELLAPAEGGDD